MQPVDSFEEDMLKIIVKRCKSMVGMITDVGNFRKINEDYVGYYIDETKEIYIVADGMGGHNAGEVASELAVNTVIEYLSNMEDTEDIEWQLTKAIKKANENIFKLACTKKEYEGMGTTITAAFIKKEKIVIANVGDSSCYIIDKDDKILKVTKDHSLVQQLIDNGSITEEEALIHPNKNVITRALGTSDLVIVDTFLLDLKEIRKAILCTDGLTNDITPKEMYDIIITNNNENACRILLESCKEKGGKDNISVIVFEGECSDDRHIARK
ncbi:Stp1/IreP family PP2C-type Ser/Thr phosphatase [Clostridium tetani]|uniref:Stp1/IreP family PP2C-type Ser/Thr phosphatase n=2 Tax=Clostridium tetani TaxID=1513 RepID=A0A4Q0VCS0_CLOTA|nr:Stp1/IreP family PP2C-type Ser/Thr phosphatase [Clostridium tetani]